MASRISDKGPDGLHDHVADTDAKLPSQPHDYAEAPVEASKEGMSSIPTIDWSLRAHKKGIIITWSVLLVSSLILPILLYFVLKYPAKLDETIVLALPTALFGAPTIVNLIMRTSKLLRKDTERSCRPLGGPRWAMDFFNLNFLAGFVAVTMVIVIGNVKLNPRVCALGLPFLVTEVSIQLIFAAILETFKIACPFRISSVAQGSPVRGGVYAISEDIIAVDSDGGLAFRGQLSARWEASSTIRRLCLLLDWAWGVTGLAVGIATIVVMFVVHNEDVGYTVGWAVPWVYAIVMGLITLQVVKVYLRRENKQETSLSRRV